MQNLTADIIASGYPNARRDGNRWRIPCPAHNGQDANCTIWDGEGGSIGAKCWSHGCSAHEIKKALGISDSSRTDRRNYVRCPVKGCKSNTETLQAIYQHPDGQGRCSHRIDYTAGDNEKGCTFKFRKRIEDELQWIVCGNKNTHKHPWGKNSPSGCYPLVWSEEGSSLLIVEGEKCAAKAMKINGYDPVTWRGGTDSVTKANWKWLSDNYKDKSVVLWPDNDDQGIKAMNIVGARLMRAGMKVSIVDVEGIVDENGDGGDIANLEEDEALKRLYLVEDFKAPEELPPPTPTRQQKLDPHPTDEAQRQRDRRDRIKWRGVAAQLPGHLDATEMLDSDIKRIFEYYKDHFRLYENVKRICITGFSGTWQIMDTYVNIEEGVRSAVYDIVLKARDDALADIRARESNGEFEGYTEYARSIFSRAPNAQHIVQIAKGITDYALRPQAGLRRFDNMDTHHMDADPVIPMLNDRGGWRIRTGKVVEPDDMREMLIIDNGVYMSEPRMEILEDKGPETKHVRELVNGPLGAILRRWSFLMTGPKKYIDVVNLPSNFGKSTLADLVSRAFGRTIITVLTQNVMNEQSIRFSPIEYALTRNLIVVIDEARTEAAMPNINRLTNTELAVEKKGKDVILEPRIGNTVFVGGEWPDLRPHEQGVRERLQWAFSQEALPPNFEPMDAEMRLALYKGPSLRYLQAWMLREAVRLKDEINGGQTPGTQASKREMHIELTDPVVTLLLRFIKSSPEGSMERSKLDDVIESAGLEAPKGRAMTKLMKNSFPRARRSKNSLRWEGVELRTQEEVNEYDAMQNYMYGDDAPEPPEMPDEDIQHYIQQAEDLANKPLPDEDIEDRPW